MPKFKGAQWAVALLGLATLAAYLPALRAGFIWDDDSVLTRNHLIKAADGLSRLWLTTEPADYWPVTSTTFWLEWRLWGMHAVGYHATNLVLHLASAVLIWTIFRRLRIPGAFPAALIFAVHPVNAESVVWIAQRKTLLAGMLMLASTLCFLKTGLTSPAAIRSRPILYYSLSLFAFTLAMLSKGSAAPLPIVLLGLIAWHRPLVWRDAARLAPFFLVAAALAAVDVWFQRHGSGEIIRSADAGERLLGAGTVVWFYLYKALWPLNLMFVYPSWNIWVGNPLWWVPLAAAMGMTVLLWRTPRFRPALFAWGYFCAMLIPVMGFTDVYFMKYSLVADHYQYLAIIGVVGLVFGKAEFGIRKAETGFRIPPSAFRFSVTAVVCGLICLTWRQSRMYANVGRLFFATVEKNPACWMAHNYLGTVLFPAGRTQEAMAHFEEALRLKPDYPEAYFNLGSALAQTGRLPEAIVQYQRALRLKPAYFEARFNLGNALAQTGGFPDAIDQYEQALRLRPLAFGVECNLGNALAQSGRLSEAIAHYENALQINPDNADVRKNLGNALARAGLAREAVVQYERLLRLEPNRAENHANLANALAQGGRLPEAIAEYERALQLQPDVPEIHNDLGVALAAAGRRREAIAHYETALRLNPGYAKARANLADALRAAGRPIPPIALP